MPCNGDHMEPNYFEDASRHACKLICYLFPKVNRAVPTWAKKAAENYYGDQARLNQAEKMLLDALQTLSHKQEDKFVYNGRSKEARALADWADGRGKQMVAEVREKEREVSEEKKAKKILSRLRKEEVDILNNYLKKNNAIPGKK
jgi:uncharacterized protein YukE